MNLVAKLLRKNLSPAQVVGFVLSNFIGIAIVMAGFQLFQDVRSIWEDEDSFIKKDYIIVNKRVSGANISSKDASAFSPGQIDELKRQPWVRSVGEFTPARYRVSATMQGASHNMSTYMFFEALPDSYVDAANSEWRYTEGSSQVPIIIAKDYLALYNFGFASSAGLPQLSEQLMGSIPMKIRISDESGTRVRELDGRIVGFSNRLNTILVPQDFMDATNAQFGSNQITAAPSRLIIDVSTPGDPAIDRYLKDNDLEIAGDKKASQASYLLNVVTGLTLGVGAVITILSFFILMLSISLLMQKNREKLHALLMLGYPLARVARPYKRLILWASLAALGLGLGAMYIFRATYIGSIEALGGGHGLWWLAPLVGVAITAAVIVGNSLAVSRKVRRAWRL